VKKSHKNKNECSEKSHVYMCLALKRLNIIIAQGISYELDNIHKYVFFLNSRALVWKIILDKQCYGCQKCHQELNVITIKGNCVIHSKSSHMFVLDMFQKCLKNVLKMFNICL